MIVLNLLNLVCVIILGQGLFKGPKLGGEYMLKSFLNLMILFSINFAYADDSVSVQINGTIYNCSEGKPSPSGVKVIYGNSSCNGDPWFPVTSATDCNNLNNGNTTSYNPVTYSYMFLGECFKFSTNRPDSKKDACKKTQ